jgi:flagellar basal-body rod protein FlgG
MIRALNIAATGMEAQQLKIDVVANNLANVNTAGFRKSRVDFSDLLYETLQPAGAVAAEGREVPTGIQIGHGTRLAATQKDFSPGELRQTGNPLDLAIEGDGFFQVVMADGRMAFTRAGTFKTDSQGRVSTSDGNLLEPAITVPADAMQVTIARDGTVAATLAGQTQPTRLGQIQLTTFTNPAGLHNVGNNLLIETAGSGAPRQGAAGSAGIGSISQGFIEMSNVKVVEEMIELITGQRAYEANSRVIKAADEMLQSTTNLR